MSSTSLVFICASLTAIATAFGVLPFYLVKNPTSQFMSKANAAAAGLMLAASVMLVMEGWAIDPQRSIIGFGLGAILIFFISKLANKHDGGIEALKDAKGKKALVLMVVMTLHSAAEGIGVGVSFVGNESFGIFIALSIALHNIPEGLAIGLVLIPIGVTVHRAALWAIFSSLPQPLLAVPAFLFVSVFEAVLPIGLGFAAGAMVWLVFAELVPEALDDQNPSTVANIICFAFIAMLCFKLVF